MQPLIVSSMMLPSFIGFMEDSDISSRGLVTRQSSKLGDHYIHPSSKTNKDPPLVHDYSARFHQLFGL